jgi:transcriptional regulator with AAA-type ATPase domain
MVTMEDLLRVDIFKDLPSENLAAIIPRLTEKTFPAGTTIIYRGDPGHSMFIILDGAVAVTLRNDEGFEYTLATLKAGDVFGEMALLTGEPRSANVKTLSAVRLFELCQESFFELVSAYPTLHDSLLRLLVQRRGRTAVHQQSPGFQRKGNIASLFAQHPPGIDRFLGRTKWTSDTNTLIERLAETEGNILILGDRGTGKDLAARLIHFREADGMRPLFHLDCADPPPVQRESEAEKVGERDALHREIAQESALFGHGVAAGSYARGVRRGYLELADGGAVVLENIDSLSPRVQRLLIQFIQEGSFTRTGETEPIASRTRLLSTAPWSLQELKKQGKLDPELLALVGSEVLHLKPLRERKKDIPDIAEHLLQEYNRKFAKSVTGFSKEALNLLVDHDWPLNVDELRQVVERAVAIANGDTITESQVFLNIPTFSATGKYNLLRIPFLRELVNHRLFPTGLRFVTIPFILGLILFTLAGPPKNNPANLIVWGIWWPFLILSIIFSARSWCGYCPLPAISDGINFYRRKFPAVPSGIVKYGIWIGIAGFALILLAEHAAHMFTAAHATSILLLTILGGATITNFFFGKRSWCKHICPLGKMIANSSALSLVELGSNSNVCSSQCQTHDCVKERTCPMGLHPSAAAASKDCILCLSCVKSCKHQSVRIDARFPWRESLAREKWDIAGAFFAVSLAALVLAVKLPSWGPLARFLANHELVNPLVADITSTLTIGLVFTALPYLASGFPGGGSWKRNFAVSGYAYLFLAFAGFFNIYFHEFVYQGHNLLPWATELAGLGAVIPADWITPNLGTMKALIPLVTLTGAISSFFMLAKLAGKYSVPPAVRRAHQGIMVIISLFFLAIL